ncbi:uncharacterized protein B0H64DRAFT_461449 [Chaetomium fimeti]|uniref:Uncharacterized protein n=1 Tax=Chaetomium fimeti TaxID=1854472 RepID=A0AAE0HGX6_9PEZI|nr:hypothetical protein B0H64DRAFT_461449 [Chaetomium fimeti]
MTVTRSTKSSFRFGVEIELLLESPGKKHKTWDSLAKDLSKQLAKAGIPNRIDDSGDYSEWSIVREVTVQDPNGQNPYQYGVELVSPVHTPASLPTLTTTLSTIFTTIHTTTTLIPTPRSSSHIHISRSPSNNPLTPLDLAALSKAALYFERALDALMPPERRTTTTTTNNNTHWAQSNRHAYNPSLAGLPLAACLAKIDAAAAAAATTTATTTTPAVPGGRDAARPVVEVMNLVAKESRYGVVRQKRADFVRGKTCKWDFSGLLMNGGGGGGGPGGEVVDRGIAGTVEFRQSPGSVKAGDAVVWVTLAVAFVAGAVEVGMGLGVEGGVREEGGSVEELWGVLMKGREVVGWADLEVLEGLFSGVGR